jgi:hypothetical protein
MHLLVRVYADLSKVGLPWRGHPIGMVRQQNMNLKRLSTESGIWDVTGINFRPELDLIFC